MKLQLKCDGCGKVGSANEIATDYDGEDLCGACRQKASLADLKQQYASRKEWLESTHLKGLRQLRGKIKRMEGKFNEKLTQDARR